MTIKLPKNRVNAVGKFINAVIKARVKMPESLLNNIIVSRLQSREYIIQMFETKADMEDINNDTNIDSHIDDYEDCQPKDLSFKSNKRIKPIPPPLNLGIQGSPLKEFAIIATSPKSPLMQKNLPFRKRAYSFSGVYESEKPDQSNTATDTVEERDEDSTHSQKTLSPVSNATNAAELTPPPDSPFNRTVRSQISSYPRSPCWSPTLTSCSFLSPGPLSPSHWITNTSVLLSPAPSSLGSSREELNGAHDTSSRITVPSPPGFFPWPAAIWHCFQAGTIISLNGSWRLAEELASSRNTADFAVPLRVLNITETERTAQSYSVRIHFRNCSASGDIIAQCHALHMFYVKEKGWCAVCPEQSYKQYGIQCQMLEPNDICLPSPKLAVNSPDICERFKRFSFPSEDRGKQVASSQPVSVQSDNVLSPPASPSKKLRNSDRPKRPMNAFMLFAKKYRLELIQLHPGKDNRAISVILGEAWRNLPATDKEVYIAEAKAMAQERKRLHPDCWKRKRSHSASFIETSNN